MRGSRMFCQRGSNFFIFFFLVDERRENTTISGPSLAPPEKRHKNGVFSGVPMMAQH